MFGGLLTLALVVVMRVLVTRQWLAGIGLNPKRRLMLPVIALVIGLLGMRRSGAQMFHSHLTVFVLFALLITVVAGLVRAATVTVTYSTMPASDLYPGGLCLRAGTGIVTTDIAALLVAALVILPWAGPIAGLHPAAGALIAVVAIGDIAASGALVLRGRPAKVGT